MGLESTQLQAYYLPSVETLESLVAFSLLLGLVKLFLALLGSEDGQAERMAHTTKRHNYDQFIHGFANIQSKSTAMVWTQSC